MDSITHIASGALIGAAFSNRTIGKRAMIAGALLQSLPDIDVVASLWLSPSDNVLAHRSITHSILFDCIASLVLGGVMFYRYRGKASYFTWLAFISIEISVHLFLDACNAYGTGWFEPFNHARLSFNTLFVVDPLYLLLLAAPVVIVLSRKSEADRLHWVRMGLAVSSLYLLMALINKRVVDDKVREALQDQHISYTRYITSPTPANIWLWYCVAEDSAGYFIGYRSVFERRRSIQLAYYPRRKDLLRNANNQHDITNLIRFSKGYYTVESRHDTLIFNDLRFGQTAGWNNPKSDFVFHYYLNSQSDNRMVVQRGRFKGWDWSTLKSLIERIAANE